MCARIYVISFLPAHTNTHTHTYIKVIAAIQSLNRVRCLHTHTGYARSPTSGARAPLRFCILCPAFAHTHTDTNINTHIACARACMHSHN